MVKELTDSNYADFIVATDDVVLIDFYSALCGPCQELMPHMEAMAAHYADKPVTIARVDVTQNPKLAQKYMVNSVPLVCLVDREKKIVFAEMGAKDRSVYVSQIEKLIGVKKSFLSWFLSER